MTNVISLIIALCVIAALMRILKYAIHANNVYHAEMDDIARQHGIEAEYYGL